MKKMLTVLLALMMGLMPCAMAEEQPLVVFSDEHVSFDVTMIVPQGYGTEQSQEGRYLHIHLVPEEEAKAEFSVSVAYSELVENKTINDMSPDEIEIVLAQVALDFLAPQITEAVTKEGTRIYLLAETEGDSDYMTAVTVYKGYFVTVEIHKADFSELTEADVAMAIEVLGDMHLMEKE